MNGLQAASATINLSAGELRDAAGTVIGDGEGVWAVIVAGQPGNPPTSGALPGGLTLGTSLTAGSVTQLASDLSGQKLQVGSVGNFYIAYLHGFDSGVSELQTEGFAFGGFTLDVNSSGDPGFAAETAWGLYWFPGQSVGSNLYGSFEVGGFANATNEASGGTAGTTVPASGTVTAQFYETTFNQEVLEGSDTGLTVDRFTAVSVAAPTGTFSWDTDITDPGSQGGTGTWDTTSPNWHIGSANNLWAATGTDNDAIFGGTAGTVTIAAGGVTANDLTFNTTGYTVTGGTLTLNGTTPTVTTAASVTATISSEIQGTAGLTKAGTGILILGGTNSYTGNTSIQDGVLVIDGSTSTGSAVVVETGAKLAGSGTVGGDTTVQSGGKYSAGAVGAAGHQTFSGDLQLQAGSIFEWDLASASTASGFDKVTVNTGGILTGSGAFRVVTDLLFTDDAPFWTQTQTWNTIFDGAGTLTGWSESLATVYSSTGTVRTNVAAYGSFTINGSTLTWTAVPETSNVLIGCLIGFGILRRRRC